MKTFKSLGLAAATSLLMLAGTPLHAQSLSLTLGEPFQTTTGAAGDILTFFGELTNRDPVNTVYLNGDSLDFEFAAASTDDTGFWINAPVSLAPLASSGNISLFSVTLSGPLGGGLYSGSFQVLGGMQPTDMNVLATADFNISAVPEPASIQLAALGLALSIAAAKRSKRRLG